MRIIKEKTLWEYLGQSRYMAARTSLQGWIKEIRNTSWSNPSELRASFGSASIIGSKRVVFNIKGNDYRLIVDIEYKLGVVFIIWFGTHLEYNKIDVKLVEYGG